MGSNADKYVSGGVNWASFTLEELVHMVADKASVPQLERLADDWRQTGESVVDAAEYLADALDDLMDFWSGEAAGQARRTVALNAQWVGDLGRTAQDMGDPIEEAAGALRSAQETMPKLPETPPAELPGAAPQGAEQAVKATEGSPLGAAVGGTAAGAESAFQARAQQEELKRVAIETMQRFEAAAVGIDHATPRFEGQSTHLRPRVDDADLTPGDGGTVVANLDLAAGIDLRWQMLTGMNGDTTAQHVTGGFDAGGGGGFSGVTGGGGGGGLPSSGGGGGLMPGLISTRGRVGDIAERSGSIGGGRGGMPTVPSGAAPGGGQHGPGMMGPMAPMAGMAGMGGQAGAQPHRRRVPFDADDPFDTGQKASPPVIGL